MANKRNNKTWEGFLPRNSIVMAKKGQSQPVMILNTQPVAKRRLSSPKSDAAISDSLPTVGQDLVGCTKCKLSRGRTHIVVGEGNPKATLVFVGEGPGEQEDLQARPFVGKAGKLLDKMIEAIGLKREDIYICNVVKCRPPQNRNPEPDEIEACSPFLYRQLDAVQPKVIVALGKFAAQTLLKTEERISSLRGRFFDYRGSKLIPTFHPSYLLRNPSAKKEAWEDLQKVAHELGLVLPKKAAGLSKPIVEPGAGL